MDNSAATSSTVISLLLHDVTDQPETSGFMQPTAFRYKHTTAQFRRYLEAVEASGLPVTIPTDPTDPSARVRPDISVNFTFDDGGASAPVAAGLLEDKGWRGLFFITTDLIGTPGFLSAHEVQDLHRRGHLIGSHSCSHPDVFRRLSRAQMQREWSHSRDVLAQLLGADITAASVPGGDIDRTTLAEAAAAGFQHIFTSEQQTRPWTHPPALCYGRLMMVDSTSVETLQRWLRHPTIGVLPERLLRFTKSGVKQLMGPMYLKLMQRRRALHEAP